MPSIAQNIIEIKNTLPPGVRMVAVSKFHPVDQLMQAYEAGQRLFGENRQQELLAKQPLMPADVQWHYIGHMQTNKVKSLVGRVAMIESVDTERLLTLIDQAAVKAAVTQDVLLQLHVAQEETKFGFSTDEMLEFFASGRYRQLQATRLRGVMGMATNTDDTERVEADFRAIRGCYDKIKALAPELELWDQVSMGMSGDYLLAIHCGANLVRIGTSIFGPRNY